MKAGKPARPVEVGAIVRYDGVLSEVIAASTDRIVVVVPVGKDPCPTCGHDHRRGLVESSPLFQEKIEPVQTIEEAS